MIANQILVAKIKAEIDKIGETDDADELVEIAICLQKDVKKLCELSFTDWAERKKEDGK